jgi:hypothetical protein
VGKSPSRPTGRWSGSLHELAVRKQQTRAVPQPTRLDKAGASAPAVPKNLDPPTVPLSVGPAAPSARSLPSSLRRRWNGDRRWQIPCWLTSFVLHLLAIVVLGSLTVPVSRQRTVMALLLSFGVEAPTEDGQAELATTISLAAVDAGALPGSDALVDSENQPPQAALTETPLIRPALPLDRSPDRPKEVVPQAPRGSSASEPPAQLAAGQGVDETPTIEATNKAQDEVVSRFIEFDVGRLRGEEGLKARQDFDRLGTEAIASLIRGLNRSAKMHASCPVVVISQKVGMILHENPQPALLRYALDNIGRDVPPSAPHVGYLQALVNRLRQLDPAHSVPNVSMIVASLKSRDVQGAIQAAQVVTAECGKFVKFEKHELAWALIHLLTHRDAELRAAAHTALIALAEGKDYGPASDRRPPDRVAAACSWSLELCPDRFEAAADSVLNMAENLADAGKGEAARRYYRKLIHEYAGTAAADEAAERLKKSAEFALK